LVGLVTAEREVGEAEDGLSSAQGMAAEPASK
jgi:hypothetical protein